MPEIRKCSMNGGGTLKKGKKTHKAQRTPNGQIRGNLSIKLVKTAMKYNPLNEIVSTDI